VKCSGGVVEDTIYEHVQVCETEGRSFGLVEEGESGDNDGLEVLRVVLERNVRWTLLSNWTHVVYIASQIKEDRFSQL